MPQLEQAPATPAASPAWAALDAVPHAVALVDDAAAIVFVNAAWRVAARDGLLAGGAGDDFLATFGAGDGDAIDQLSSRNVVGAARAVVSGGKDASSAQYRRRVGDKAHWFHVVVRRRTDAPGAMLVFEDRTAIREHYTDAVEANRILRDVLDHLPRRAFWKDMEGRLIGGNTSFFEDFGRENLIGKSIDEISWSHAVARFFRDTDERVVATGESQAGLVEVAATADQPVRWLEIANAPLKRGDGAVIGTIGSYVDVTEEHLLREAVRESEERLRLTLDGAEIGTFDYDLATGHTTYTDRCAQMLLYSPGELNGEVEAWSSLIHPEDKAEGAQRLAAHIQGRTENYSYEKRMLAKDRSWRWIREIGRVLTRAADGTPTRLVGICIDITDERNARDRVEEIARRLHLATHASQIGIWEYDYKSRTMQWDDRLFEIYGRAGRAFDPAEWPSCVHADDFDRVKAAIDKLDRGVAPLDLTFRIVKPDGSLAHVRSQGAVEKSVLGKTLRAVGTTLDVTAAAAASEAVLLAKQQLEAANKRLGDFVATGSDWLWECDHKTVLTEVSERFFEKSGYDRRDIVGKSIAMFMPTEAQARESADVQRVKQLQDFRDLSLQLPLKDGSLMHLRISGKAQYDAHGRFTGYLGTASDVTGAVRQGNAAKQAQKLQAVGTLASGVAHEFNNILAIIRGYADIAKRALERGDTSTEDLEQIIEAAARGASLTKGLLAFGRKSAPDDVSVFDLGDLVTEQRLFLRPLTGPQFELAVDKTPGPALIRARRDGVAQALMNMVLNARDAAPNGGRIELAVDLVDAADVVSRFGPAPAEGRFVRVRVSDDGAGMDDATLRRIFEPFFTTKEVGKGTGLGLHFVYQLIADCGGYVNVASEVGRGTTFALHFPEAQAVETAIPAVAGSLEHHAGHTALVVDDEPSLVAIYKGMLESLGFAVKASSDPEAALEIVDGHAGDLDLILSDVLMPGMQGPHFAELARALHPEARVLFVTGQPERGAQANSSLPAGAHVLRKPFTREELGAELANVFAGEAMQRTA
jgi:two-component system, cell cycle sensor histidine kinase and response regulator CckA